MAPLYRGSTVCYHVVDIGFFVGVVEEAWEDIGVENVIKR